MTVSMGNVWDRASEFLGDNRSAVLPVAALAILLPDALSASIAPLAVRSETARVAIGLLNLALMLLSLWGQLAIVALALAPAAGRRPALRTANARIAPLIGLWLLLLVGTIVLCLPIPIAMGLAGYDFRAAMNGATTDMPVAAGSFAALYGVLVLLPLLVFIAARLVLLMPVVAMERRGIGAFRRAFQLTRGITWKVIGVVLLYGIVFGVAFLAARTVFGSIFELIAGGEGTISAATVLTSVVVAAVQAVFAVLAAAFVAKLYLAVADARGTIVEPA